MDASAVRGSFAKVVDSVHDRDDVVVIVRYGRPIAALVPTMRLTRLERDALGSSATIGGRHRAKGPTSRDQPSRKRAAALR